jgi:hypothetical protein
MRVKKDRRKVSHVRERGMNTMKYEGKKQRPYFTTANRWVKALPS